MRVNKARIGRYAFPHTRPCCQNHQIGFIEPAQQAVEIGKAGRHSDDILLLGVQFFDAGQVIFGDLPHRHEVARGALLADREQLLLRSIEHDIDIFFFFKGKLGDVAGRFEKIAANGGCFNNAAVAGGVNRRGNNADQTHDVCFPPNVFQLVAPSQLFDDGQGVNRFAAIVKRQNSFVYPAMGNAVEGVRF